ncbi:unnamed protein product [Thlaspi arvense]|uniref:Uncharacterized protein n=1 Tax=Thlaspi arvense TaxID=13288 RepID=A0AAU9RBL1_THLAR|nr:unnamed protein product [Thlaspi arvense]
MHVAMFPWLAMGHLLPFLRLSKLLAQKGHKFSFILTPRNIERLPKLPSNISSSITFVSLSLPLPPFSGSTPGSECSMEIPYNKQQSLKSAFDLLQAPLTEFLQRSSPDWVIFDYASYWLPQVAAELGISKGFFSIFSAATLCFLGPPSSAIKDIRSTPEDFTVVPPWIPFQSNVAFRYHEITWYGDMTEEDPTGVSDSVRFGYSISGSDAVFVHSSLELEPEYFGLLQNLYEKPVFPTGFLPSSIEDEVEGDRDTTWVGIKKWLDKHRVNSVVYVALGTEASLSPTQLAELAHGLEKSEVHFFWALRNDSQIPEGFEERVKGRGMVHIGCGRARVWASSDTLPMSDQGLNTRMLEGKGLGVEIPRDEREGSFDSDSVAHSVRLAMVDDAGESIRAKAKLMKGLIVNIDNNYRHVDELVRFMTSETCSSLVADK